VTRAFRSFCLLAFPLLLAGCASSDRLTISGELSRTAKAPTGGTQAVVSDFEYAAPVPGVVGRDYDQVRPIVWDGKPGKAMADLVASVLAGNGVRVVRTAADGPFPDDVPIRISGAVRTFEVNARRPGGLNVITTEAKVSVLITASGGSLFVPWESAVSSATSMKDLFVTPDDARDALFSSANAVAEEAVRRLLEAGVVAPPPSGK
jgi:hypothetical protein